MTKRLNYKIYVALFFFSVFVLFRPPADPDFGWHYKYGEYIFNNHKILKENTFSYNLQNYKWANSYWGSEFVMFTLYKYFGAIGMSLTFSAVLTLCILAIISKTKAHIVIQALAVIFLAIILSSYLITVRPMFFSSMFLMTLTYILLYKKSFIKFTPLLFLLWANFHADFILGLFILGLHTAFELFENYKLKARKFILILFFPLLSVFTTLINPYGLELWRTLLKEIHPYQFSHVAEWTPAGDGNKIYFVFFVTILALIVVSVWETGRKHFGLWYALSVLIFFALSVRSVYFFRPLIIIGVFSVILFLNTYFGNITKNFDDKLKSKLYFAFRLSLSSIFLLIALSVFVENLYLASDASLWSEEYKYPYKAVRYIKENKIEGKMFNNYGWGGYLIWKLPEYKTFVDGRMPSWREGGKSLFEDYIDITAKPDKMYNKFLANEAKWILDKPDSKLVKDLVKSKNWKEFYRDNSAVIIVSLD